MPVPLVVDKLEAAPEAIRNEYVAGEGGKFYLQGTGANGYEIANTVSLKTALQAERKAASEHAAKLKEYEGIDAAKAREALKTLDELGDIRELKDLDSKLAAREKQLTEKFEKDRKGLETKFGNELQQAQQALKVTEQQLATTLIDSRAAAAITEAKGSVELLLPIIKNQVRMSRNQQGKSIVEVIDANGEVRPSPSSGSIDNMTIKELVEELKNNPAYARAFDGSSASGGGANGGTAGGGSGGHSISANDARDPAKYRAAKEAAAKAGKRLEIV